MQAFSVCGPCTTSESVKKPLKPGARHQSVGKSFRDHHRPAAVRRNICPLSQRAFRPVRLQDQEQASHPRAFAANWGTHATHAHRDPGRPWSRDLLPGASALFRRQLPVGSSGRANQDQPGVGSRLLQSLGGLEATFRKKGHRAYKGYVANLTETCDLDNELQLITKIQVTPHNSNEFPCCG